jgi:hypothetical protein
MKFWKIGGLLVLVVVLVCAFSTLAAAQTIMFKTPKQFVNLGITVPDGTIAPTDVWTQKMPDLTTLNFAIPKKKYVAFTSISMRFIPDSNTAGAYRLIFADQLPAAGVTPIVYHSLSLDNSFSNNVFTHAYSVSDFCPGGLFFSKMPAIYVVKTTDPTQPVAGDPIPGMVRITLFGYTAP